jgi:pimeloyl-ACP methyl ester carboxylesterase
MRDDVRDFADALRLSRFHLIGHSMGATVSILFAERWPSRIDHLVLEDTPPPSGREQTPAPAPDAPEPVPFDWAVLAPIIRQLNNPDPAWWTDLGNISAPTLVIGGGHDSFIDQAELSHMVSRIPDARLVTIEAGHHVHSTKPDEFALAIQAFLAE